jgi:hypothetical protein
MNNKILPRKPSSYSLQHGFDMLPRPTTVWTSTERIAQAYTDCCAQDVSVRDKHLKIKDSTVPTSGQYFFAPAI